MKISRLIWRIRKEMHRFNRHERRLWQKKTRLVSRFHDQYWDEVAALVGANCEVLGGGFRRISKGHQWTVVSDGDVMLDSRVALRMAGNKVLMYRLMADWGVSNLPGYCICKSTVTAAATEMLRSGPVVTKPAAGTGGGRGVTTRIASTEGLRRGIAIAAKFDETVLVEEFIEANSYRLLYLDGELLDAIWRRSPTVVGNGRSTIDELVNAENQLRESAVDLRALSFITKTKEYDNQLAHLGLARRTIPAAGDVVMVKSVVNQNNASENERVLDVIHPSIVAKCADICRRAKLRFVGVDLLAADIGRDWNEQQVYVNELNTTPGLHHHVLTATGSDNHRVGTRLLSHLLASQ